MFDALVSSDHDDLLNIKLADEISGSADRSLPDEGWPDPLLDCVIFPIGIAAEVASPLSNSHRLWTTYF
jgi:hypothetical protein